MSGSKRPISVEDFLFASGLDLMTWCEEYTSEGIEYCHWRVSWVELLIDVLTKLVSPTLDKEKAHFKAVFDFFARANYDCYELTESEPMPCEVLRWFLDSTRIDAFTIIGSNQTILSYLLKASRPNFDLIRKSIVKAPKLTDNNNNNTNITVRYDQQPLRMIVKGLINGDFLPDPEKSSFRDMFMGSSSRGNAYDRCNMCLNLWMLLVNHGFTPFVPCPESTLLLDIFKRSIGMNERFGFSTGGYDSSFGGTSATGRVDTQRIKKTLRSMLEYALANDVWLRMSEQDATRSPIREKILAILA